MRSGFEAAGGRLIPRLVVLGLLLVLSGSARLAAAIEVEAHLDREQVALGDRLTLTVTVNGGGGSARPELPELPDFAVYPAGTSRNFSFVNGRIASATVFTYILAPKREGTFEIPPVAIVEGGTRVTSRPLSVTVAGEGSSPSPGSGAFPPPAASGRAGSTPDSKAVVMTAEAEPKNPFVGEQVTLTVRFYQGVRLLERPDYRPPVSTGFWVESLPGERTYYTDVQGRRYHVTELKTALFPTESGALTIGPAKVECLIETDPFGRDPFSWFRGGVGMGDPRTVESKPIEVEVRPIPKTGRPAGFSGAVGRYSLEAALDPAQVRVGEAATLTVTLTGQGNIRAVGDPELPEIPGMRSFDSGSTIEDKRDGGRFGGVKKLTRVYVAETSGRYVVPAIRYPVFRPDRGEFETLTTKALDLNVLEGDGTVPLVPGAPRSVVATSGGANLRFIRLGDPALQRDRGPLWTRTGFWLLQIVPLLGLAGAFLFARHKEREETDQGYARLRRSGKDARRRLRHARALLDRKDPKAFYGAVSQALLGYVADRTNRQAPGLTTDSVRALLDERKIEPALIDRFAACLERCDFGRFAPAAEGVEDEVLAEAEALLTSLGRAGL